MIDSEIIINGVLAGLATEHLKTGSDHETLCEHLTDIKRLIHLQNQYYQAHMLPVEATDLYKIVSIAKSPLYGPAWIIDPEGRQYTRVLVAVSTPLSVSCVLGTFVLTIPPATWTPLDLPERSTIILDSTATSNTTSMFVRYTNQHP